MNRREFLMFGSLSALYLAGCRSKGEEEMGISVTSKPVLSTKEVIPTETPTLGVATATDVADETSAVNVETATPLVVPTIIPTEVLPTREVLKRPGIVRSVYINLDDVSKHEKVEAMFQNMDGWGANSIVVEIKNDQGNINVPFEHPMMPIDKNHESRVEDLISLTVKARALGIHLIARQVVTVDKKMSNSNQYSYLTMREADYVRPGWLDPRREEVVAYTAAVSKAAVDFGFDEIQLDYIRFPGDTIRYYLSHEERVGAICNVLARVRTAIDGNALLTADFFGGTPTTPDSLPDMGIGQNIILAAPYLDGICPMLYPDVHSTGAEVDEYGYLFEGVTKTLEKLAIGGNPGAFVNPWIQAYTESLQEIYSQERGAFDAGAVGVHAWNNILYYPEGIFKIEEDQ